ncbi:hypothetical protein JZ785_10600 [Alicyclobacillus curvatus]|nr:hypothetical protein JZ785_10600 [Alicyclobacillus curvatus]
MGATQASIIAWEVAGIIAIILLLALLFIGNAFGTVLDEFFEALLMKIGQKKFVRGVYSIMHEFSDDDKAVEEIKLLYNRTASNFNILKREKFTAAWDMVDYFIYRIDSNSEEYFKNTYGLKDVNKIRKRLSVMRDMLHEEFHYPYVEGEQSHLFKALGIAIKSDDKHEASEVLQELADLVARDRKLKQKRERRSFLWTVSGTIAGVIGLVLAVLSLKP